jgi:peptidoglycan-associated lipoprotein
MKTRMIATMAITMTLALTLAACGCFHQAMKGEAAPIPPSAVMEQTPMAAIPAPTDEEGAPPVVYSYGKAEPLLGEVHFDFDRYAIRSGDAEVLDRNYEWFTANPGRVRIEGNADERGTVEYNMALGQKRADAAKSYLVGLGVDDGRLDTISYGKERPVDPGHNEKAWAENRRDDFRPLE